jgi:ATP-dependent helicase/nuclease subunit A
MTAAPPVPRPRLAAQRQAADPEASAWVTANAGTGKTDVLTDRVTHLLLAGTRPGAILCLTFTKAAAAVMAKRLIERLGGWTMLPDAALAAEIADLLGRPAGDDEMIRARHLFARMLDAPGGLRLQTVHAFCESVLKRFPLEARVPPYFSVADDAAAAELVERAREKLFGDTAQRPQLKAALDFAAGQAGDEDFGTMLKEIIGQRRKIAALFQAHGGRKPVVAATRIALDLAPGDTVDKTIAAFLAALPAADLRRAVAALAQGGKTDRERAGDIMAWLDAADRALRVKDQWQPIFLTGKGKAREDLCSKGVMKAAPDLETILRREQDRVVALKDRLDALHIAHATEALLTLGEAFLEHYATAKRRHALLDYDDLILTTRELLRRPAVAAWVLYKLDGGIDHILVDEAQDTAPEQWAVVEGLADEFFAGVGAREGPRTVFAVGDEKQSIFSFQGADVRRFAATRQRFAARAQAAGANWAAPALEVSFRSVPAVLEFVDAIFASEAVRAGVASGPIRHRVFRQAQPGLVEIWPPVLAGERDDAEPWDAATTYAGGQSPPETLATRIAETIRGWLDGGEALAASGQPIRPGDVMILVQSRNAFFEAMVRALKVANVPVAGADRLKLAEHIAVMDLVALGRFVLLPADELNLATVLKGPLFDFDDDDLFELCWGRGDTKLWPVLLARGNERPRWAKAAAELHRLLERADFVPPYEFFAEILGAWRGRERIVARLGAEATDPLDEFLASCLAFEREHSPSLEAFLHWLTRGGKEIKRDLEQDRDEVRVLTVHGAKGLESRVVFLPDTCVTPGGKKPPRLLWQANVEADQGGLLFWPTRLSRETAAVRDARAADKLAHAEEHRRLLYVAATRAQDRLYVCGWHRKAPPAGSWYAHMQAALAALPGVAEFTLPWGEQGRRLAHAAKAPLAAQEPPPAQPPARLPAWAASPPAAEPVPGRPLTPSRPAIAEPPGAPLGSDLGRAFQRGRLIHRLLEILASLDQDQRPTAAARYLASPLHGLTVAAQKKLAKDVLKIFAKPEFAAVFGADSLAEAPIAGRIGDTAVAGQIDRLVVREHDVLVVDFKSGRQPPKRPEQVSPAYIRQLALYRAVVRGIFPAKTVRCALLWTDKPSLMEIPDTVLATADI